MLYYKYKVSRGKLPPTNSLRETRREYAGWSEQSGSRSGYRYPIIRQPRDMLLGDNVPYSDSQHYES